MSQTTNIWRYSIIIPVVIGVVLAVPVFARISDDEFEEIVHNEMNSDSNIVELNSEIERRAAEVRELEEKRAVYESNIKAKQNEILTLQSQVSLLDDKIEETRIDIARAEIELDVLQLEIEVLKEQIDESEIDIDRSKEMISDLLRSIYSYDQHTTLEITFGNGTLSEFFSDMEYTNSVQSSMQDTLDTLQNVRTELKTRRSELGEKKAEIALKKTNLELNEDNLEGEETFKAQLLAETKLSEDKFQLLLDTVKDEQSSIEGQISALESSVQEKIINIRTEVQDRLNDGDDSNDSITDEEQDLLDGVVRFAWPVDSRTITCGFHCQDYPFRRWFEHSGMDVATPMGSNVYAAASGYVGIASFDGTSRYAYIMLVHGNGLASVYGHVSCVTVQPDQYVSRGQMIGCSGGMPGTPGAGSYSTGPHLHFEIRVNGIPTNPMNYLQ
ncbi:MAG: peptidoglycan DD-metalloendopeptidase family protein [Candidatus Kerfeldbacteria bacterium]